METAEPKLILVISGKRKSGKDYVSGLIAERLGAEACCVLRLSGPLKRQYAQERGLDLAGLLGVGGYKERHRADMIRWGERRRERDPGCFCRAAVGDATITATTAPVWVVSDARRPSDLQWFRREYAGVPVRCVRVRASSRTRAGRGWVFVAGIDDAESECALNGVEEFDWTISNDETDARPTLSEQLRPVLSLAEAAAAGRRLDGHPLPMLTSDNQQYIKVDGK